MSQELVDNENMTTPEIKAKQEKMYAWEDVIPEQDKPKEELWRPETVGETLTGKYLYKKESMGKYKQTIYIIEDEIGKLWSVFDCKVLHNLFEYVEEGDFIKITFEGRKYANTGNSFKLFTIQRRIKVSDGEPFNFKINE